MIFISHTFKDKPIVEPIALRLSSIFGQENVFYDSWSIQPGDGIIEKMNSGLTECEFFFFFVSKNSLQSKMVSLEWENTLLKATNGDVKLIPVKLDDCLMPAILMQSLYIDIFGKGLEVGIRQMVDVIQNRNTFRPQIQTYENIRGHVSLHSESECTIAYYAEYYLEPISRYAVLVDNSVDNIDMKCLSDGMFSHRSSMNIKLNNGEVHNCIFCSVTRGTAPGFPFRIHLKTKNNERLVVCGLMHAVNEKNYQCIPMITTEEKDE